MKSPHTITDKEYERMLEDIVKRILEIAVGIVGWSPMRLAAEANVSNTTLYRLMWKETKLPRHKTIIKLASAVGIEFHMFEHFKKRKVG